MRYQVTVRWHTFPHITMRRAFTDSLPYAGALASDWLFRGKAGIHREVSVLDTSTGRLVDPAASD